MNSHLPEQPGSAPLDVTVIVAAWNRENLIARTLDSIAAQTRRPRQVFVIDDASRDNTAQAVEGWIAAHDLPVTLLVNPENRGVAETRNAGLRQAATRYAAFLDSDDIWLPDALERLTPPLEQDPHAAVSCADASVVGDDAGAQKVAPDLFVPRLDLARDVIPARSGVPGQLELADPSDLLLLTSTIPTCSAVFRLDVAREAGFMPDFRSGEDWLFWLRLARRGRFLCQLAPVAHVLRHEANLTHHSRNAFTAREHLRALLALQDGSLGVVLTSAEQARVAAALAEKARDWRYHLSRQGSRAYWQGLDCAQGRATGGRLHHLLADPRSIVRAILAGF
jgi:glycosyltransferase involved in cell wall biosynthesis